jgi:L-seryl-tRNA(Ser) seleniumtransferase
VYPVPCAGTTGTPIPADTLSNVTPRALPSVHDLIEKLPPATSRLPHRLLADEARAVIDEARRSILRGAISEAPLERTLEARLAEWLAPSLRRVVNATGVILHTNLGRAPLPNFEIPAGYSNLEYDLATGRRSKRDAHTGKLLAAILGKPAIVVNNNAAALFLILNELASGGEAIISRGELIEIGEGFRIPDIMQRSGAILREVGATNRTTIDDYRQAISANTRLIVRVHPSNFRMTGFTGRPRLADLVQLGRESCIPVYEDLGSGCLIDLRPSGIDEPLARTSLDAGVNLISFSGDKLLGGPQAGIIAGDAELVPRVRRNPLFRAFRQDKLVYAALETTLRHILLEQYDCVPALRMIRLTAEQIRGRAENLAKRLSGSLSIEPGESVIGGGSTPELSLPTWLIAVEEENANALEQRLRANAPPIISRIERDRVVLDLRTVFQEEEDAIVQALS